MDGGHAHPAPWPLLPVLHQQRLHHALVGVLGGAVCREEGRPCDPRRGRHAEDVAPVEFDHAREEGLEGPELGEDVHAEDAINVVLKKERKMLLI